jgi:hypothetical protein
MIRSGRDARGPEDISGNRDAGDRAAAGPAGQRQSEAIAVGNRLCDRQAEACALYVRRGRPKEAIEDSRQRLGGMPLPESMTSTSPSPTGRRRRLSACGVFLCRHSLKRLNGIFRALWRPKIQSDRLK